MSDQFRTALPRSSYESLKLLIEGNQRFLERKRLFETKTCAERLKEVAEKGQSPFCIVLTCSDSRVPVETIFDVGFGEIFVIRVAGNVLSSDIIASIEYAAEQFNTPLCVVMGHTECGAVTAAVQYVQSGSCNLSGFGQNLLQKIAPSVEEALNLAPQQNTPALISSTIQINVLKNKNNLLEKSSLLHLRINEGKFFVVGALYDLHSGRVLFDTDASHSRKGNPSSEGQNSFCENQKSVAVS